MDDVGSSRRSRKLFLKWCSFGCLSIDGANQTLTWVDVTSSIPQQITAPYFPIQVKTISKQEDWENTIMIPISKMKN